MKQIFGNKRAFLKNFIPVVLIFVLSDFIFRYIFKLKTCGRSYFGNPFDIGASSGTTSCEANNLLILFYAVVLTLLIAYIYKNIIKKINAKDNDKTSIE